MNSPLHGPAKAVRLAAIGAVMLAAGAGFAYAAGWLGESRLTPQRIIDTFEAQAGHYPGYRKNHAKGLCVSGYFQASGQAANLSTARVFSQARVPVTGRFAIGGANPFAPDTGIPVRSLAIQLSTDDGQVWRTGMNNPPVLAISTPQGFYDQVLANTPDPATGKPNPASLQAFFAAHPESAAFRQWAAGYKPSNSFASTQYHSINAFHLIDAGGAYTRCAGSLSRKPRLPRCPPRSMTNSFCNMTCSNAWPRARCVGRFAWCWPNPAMRWTTLPGPGLPSGAA